MTPFSLVNPVAPGHSLCLSLWTNKVGLEPTFFSCKPSGPRPLSLFSHVWLTPDPCQKRARNWLAMHLALSSYVLSPVLAPVAPWPQLSLSLSNCLNFSAHCQANPPQSRAERPTTKKRWRKVFNFSYIGAVQRRIQQWRSTICKGKQRKKTRGDGTIPLVFSFSCWDKISYLNLFNSLLKVNLNKF